MEIAGKLANTAALALYGLYQMGYWLVTGHGHPGFDGLWRYGFEFGEIWGIERRRPSEDADAGATGGAAR